MELKETQVLLRELHAAEGHMLTQSADGPPLSERVITDRLVLAASADPSEWKEITQEEADALQAEIKADREAEFAARRKAHGPAEPDPDPESDPAV